MKEFQGKRWMIVYGNYQGMEALAVNELYKVIQQFVPYVPTVSDADGDDSRYTGRHILLVGTVRSNRLIARLAGDGQIMPNANKEGYLIKHGKSCFDSQYDMTVICGADEAGTLYGVYDFEHYHVDPAKYADFPTRIYLLRNPFLDGMGEFEASGSPAVENRGLWTWGHTVYDYRRYLDNMCRWKLNTLILWNDDAPLNIDEIIAYARARGIRIVWGFSWSWGEEIDPTDEKELGKWVSKAIETYRVQYAPHQVDEIYYQLFTETFDEAIEGQNLARLAVKWTNAIAGELLKAYPALKIQFGLHALSGAVKNGIDCFQGIDPRVTITWEDCGSFPYHYDANVTDHHADTLRMTDRICGLRGPDEDFGAVMKGMTSLNWAEFEHIRGPFVLGESKRSFVDSKVCDKRPYWKYIQANWIRNLSCLTDTVRVICSKGIKRATVTALVEDGGWEDKMWYPAALFAETLWNPHQPPEVILQKVANNDDVYFA